MQTFPNAHYTFLNRLQWYKRLVILTDYAQKWQRLLEKPTIYMDRIITQYISIKNA